MTRKHPRIRGESYDDAHLPEDGSETSPHTRGKLTGNSYIKYVTGNIPAYAGKAQSSSRQTHAR